jgi:hypothetical protein
MDSQTTINNPYWTLYQKLVYLRDKPASKASKAKLVEISQDCQFGVLDSWFVSLLLYCRSFSNRTLEERFFLKLREHYAYSALSPAVLDIVARYSPLVELGAGNGYTSSLLQKMGADLIPLDAYPVEEGKNWFFNTRFGLPRKGMQSWTKIEKGGAEELAQYSERTLLLCWPARSRMAVDALDNYTGCTTILIADKTCCGNPAFYKKLTKDWRLELSIDTESWSACHQEVLEIYTRAN